MGRATDVDNSKLSPLHTASSVYSRPAPKILYEGGCVDVKLAIIVVIKQSDLDIRVMKEIKG